MEKSIFRYKVTGEHLLEDCSTGIYYKGAREEGGAPKRQCVIMDYESDCVIMDYESKCVIMDYKSDGENAISQIQLSCEMGDEYALEVVHIDNRHEPPLMKVIYPFFNETMSKWLENLKNKYQPPENEATDGENEVADGENKAKEYRELMKDNVMPKIRKLWKLLLKMKEKRTQFLCKGNNNQGDNMPVINGVPKLLNLKHVFAGESNLDMNYALSISRDIVDLDTAREFVPKSFRSALEKFWEDEIKINKTNSDYDLCSKHPVLYDPADKERFFFLMNHITSSWQLKRWLNGEFNWISFVNQINEAETYRAVYLATLHHNDAQNLGVLESPNYSTGSDIVRYTRNVLAHFKENYKKCFKKDWDSRQDGREIVEILDDDLDVCSYLFSMARTIMAEDPPQEYMEKNWNEARRELNYFFDSLK